MVAHATSLASEVDPFRKQVREVPCGALGGGTLVSPAALTQRRSRLGSFQLLAGAFYGRLISPEFARATHFDPRLGVCSHSRANANWSNTIRATPLVGLLVFPFIDE